MSARGRFVTFEGIDGAGKSSHIERATKWLHDRGHDVVVTREPGGTELAEQLRALLLHRPMDVLTEVLLIFAARRDHLRLAIEPALADGRTVLCDRFTDATFAYQGSGRGFDGAVLALLEEQVQQGRQPDMTLWFDVAPELAASRRQAVRAPDRFEALDLAFFGRVRQGYAARAAQAPQRFRRLAADGDVDTVWSQVERVLQDARWW